MSAGEFPPKTVRLLFYVREDECCFRCGRALRWEDRGIGWSAHHRKPRGRGGTSNAAIGSPANCLILCGSGTTGCHGWVESHRSDALEQGYLIPLNAKTWKYEPDEVRVCRDGSWWLLTNTGGCHEVDAKEGVGR